MQGKGLISNEMIFRVVSASGEVIESSVPYTGLKDCVAAFNHVWEPNDEVSYSKVYRNIRLFGFHCEAVQYTVAGINGHVFSAIAVFTGINAPKAQHKNKALSLFSQVESQESAPLVQKQVFPSVEVEAEQIYAQWKQGVDNMLGIYRHEVNTFMPEVRANRAKGIAKVLKQGTEKKVPQKARKAAKKA